MNTTWKPKAWIAIILGALLYSFTFLYVNRARWFWFYLVLSIVLALVDFRYHSFFIYLLAVICPVHAYLVIKKYDISSKRHWYSTWWGILATLTSILAVLFLFRSFLYEPFSIPSSSMAPNLKVGSHIVVSKLGYRTYGSLGVTLLKDQLSSPSLMERGEIYVFRHPKNENTPYVKRLIAVPGDSVAVKGSEVIVNGVSLPTSLVKETEQFKYYKQQVGKQAFYIQHTKSQRKSDMHLQFVPPNSYFFLGDNRDNSNDSRFWGFVPSDNIIGEVVYKF